LFFSRFDTRQLSAPLVVFWDLTFSGTEFIIEYGKNVNGHSKVTIAWCCYC